MPERREYQNIDWLQTVMQVEWEICRGLFVVYLKREKLYGVN
jgi:hypothetical protein